MCSAILKAGAALKQQLIEAAAPLLEYAPEELRTEAGCVLVAAQPDQRLSYAEILQRNELSALEATGEFATKGGLDPETGQGLSTPHWHQGAGACEVTVDTDTGKVTVLRYHAASFAGRVVNPQLAHLQNEGNVIFGLGPALLEEMVADNGQIINTNRRTGCTRCSKPLLITPLFNVLTALLVLFCRWWPCSSSSPSRMIRPFETIWPEIYAAVVVMATFLRR